MGLREALHRLAAGAPVPVFAVAGAGAREAVQDLRLSSALRLVDTPRAASVLLLAGALPDSLAEPLARVHDGLPPPRGTVRWRLGAPPGGLADGFADLVVDDGDPVAAIGRVQRELLAGRRPSAPPHLPDVDPAPWRGVGPFGQGGTGMTGGVPYGRPLAGLRDDRDGLRLDVLPLKVGPFYPRFPTGLVLAVTFAGDVVVDAAAEPNPFATAPLAATGYSPGLRAFWRALVEPVPVAELELARARAHLRWVADALTAQGLPALGARTLRLAQRAGPADGAAVRGLARGIDWTQVLGWASAGVGRLDGAAAAAVGGPVARAAGLAEDVRLDDPAYRALGFEPVVHQTADAAARWRQRLAEAAQSLDLAARAGDRRTTPTGAVESPRGRLGGRSAPTGRLLPLLPRLLQGQEWGDVVTTLVSLDLDLEEAGLVEGSAAAGLAA